MTTLEKTIEYAFKDKRLLEQAMTHSSYANERRSRVIESNERLEFLGDSILGFAVADFLYRNRGDMPEGKMTRIRAELVCEGSLFEAALSINLGDYLKLGKGEESNGGRERPSLLANAFEALIAAVYLDGGERAAADIIDKHILTKIHEAERQNFDYKTALQEHVQKTPGSTIKYHLIEEMGPDHQKTFRVQVSVDEGVMGYGEGGSKKTAEQQAAQQALEAFGIL